MVSDDFDVGIPAPADRAVPTRTPAGDGTNDPAYELWRREERTDGNDRGVYRWMIWLVGPGEDASYAEWFATEEEARAKFAALTSPEARP